MQTKTADPEAILRRFSRSEVMHPTYQALSERGRAVTTIFLCRYLREESFRREIHEGLTVVDNWNTANGSVFLGKGGGIATNPSVAQQLSVLPLRCLPASLVIGTPRRVPAGRVDPN